MNRIKKYICFCFICITFLCFTNNLFAVPANPNPIKITQPDGTNITIQARGDEFYHWDETSEGYTILKDTETKFWTYAQKNQDGSLLPSSYIVGKVSAISTGLHKSLKDDIKLNAAQTKISALNTYSQKTYQKISQQLSSQNKTVSSIGTKKNLVILVEFSDLGFRDNKPFSSSSTDNEIRAEYDKLFNTTNYTEDGAVGSVKDFFNEVSYGALTMESVISPIVKLDSSYVEYGESSSATKTSRDMVKEALAKLEAAGYDFKAIWPSSDEPEGLTFIHAGGGAEYAGNDSAYIWSHKWSLATPVIYDGITFSLFHTEPARRGWDIAASTQGLTRIGVICHESTHFFGMPDLYDYTYTSEGLGKFCLMSGGSWNASDSNNAGNCPAHPSAWIKYQLGWIVPKTPKAGTNTIGTSATSSVAFYKLTGEYFSASEYFLMENRQSVGFDKYIPGTTRGILIYHVDETQSDNNDRTHYLVDLEEADGTAVWTNDHLANDTNSGLDSDYYRNNTVTVFNDSCSSSPNSKSYSYQSSSIDISQISASNAVMSFVAPEQPNYTNFIEYLTDTKGVKFLNLVMKYSPEKTKTELLLLDTTEQANINKYFTFTTSGALEADNMYNIYDAYNNNLSIYDIQKTQTGLVSASQANLINKLNYDLKNSSQSFTSVGNISTNNNPPTEEDTSTAINNKRFTGTEAITNIATYSEELGYLFPKLSDMYSGEGYDIIEVISTMNISQYTNYVYIQGEAVIYHDLSNVVFFPNPARNGQINIIKLPSNSSTLDIQIYTITGKIVKTFNISDTQLNGDGSRSLKWNCKNQGGDNVAPGVYLIMIKTSSDKKISKIAIIR
ncbi:MAG: M6 family metalloprotease domain-containing protein [Endomicrobiia bacterium]|nr:M6 family metalloprotease domain-containing protein [Endomicrobiaceae bacterium]MDD3053105.1 M6 family metalloprotease domain-containing protein [Endomicrobiaceae bacterium]MDD3922698.1 M6 family metalloprotease domain-containing protein [Endomicrobiaceae bacterium]